MPPGLPARTVPGLTVYYVVYWDAADAPKRYAVRRWLSTPRYPRRVPEEQLFCVETDLAEVRRRIQADNPRATNRGRRPGEDPCITEMWT